MEVLCIFCQSLLGLHLDGCLISFRYANALLIDYVIIHMECS